MLDYYIERQTRRVRVAANISQFLAEWVEQKAMAENVSISAIIEAALRYSYEVERAAEQVDRLKEQQKGQEQ